MCTSCKHSTIMSIKEDNRCHCNDDSNWFNSNDNTCLPCNPRCGRCDGPWSDNCTMCRKNAFMTEDYECECILNYEWDSTTLDCIPKKFCSDCADGVYETNEGYKE
jgi:proprotein convertase subtilisin/kexin type 5